MTVEQQVVVDRISKSAVEAELATGCPAEITAAQCILESGYLAHAPGNNCFGVKQYTGCHGTQLLDTSEWFTAEEAARFLARGGGRAAILVQPVRTNANGRNHYACRDLFATFATLAECFVYHGKLIQRGVYAAAWEQYQKDHDLSTYIAGVAKHYATDPQYAATVSKVAGGPYVSASVIRSRDAAIKA